MQKNICEGRDFRNLKRLFVCVSYIHTSDVSSPLHPEHENSPDKSPVRAEPICRSFTAAARRPRARTSVRRAKRGPPRNLRFASLRLDIAFEANFCAGYRTAKIVLQKSNYTKIPRETSVSRGILRRSVFNLVESNVKLGRTKVERYLFRKRALHCSGTAGCVSYQERDP